MRGRSHERPGSKRPQRLLFLSALLFMSQPLPSMPFQPISDYSQHRLSRRIRTLSNLYASVNPNDLESDEDRAKRMELVKQLQKSFYQDAPSASYQKGGCILQDLPLWRVKWTELPGYNNILNCHVPHYTHMFQGVVNQNSENDYFGHVFLPDGSENLDNPKYFFSKSSQSEEEMPPDTTTVGVLMQVSDYQQLDDGRLLIVAQAVERIQVLHAKQQVPYAIADVQILPDDELIQSHIQKAMEMTDDKEMAWQAARVAAVAEAMHWHPFEVRTVTLQECTVTAATTGVSPLINYDPNKVPTEAFDSQQVMRAFLNGKDDTRSGGDEEQLFPDDSDLFEGLLETKAGETKLLDNIDTKLKEALKMEYEVWVALDLMLRLLTKVNPDPATRIPVPAQLLGLLPSEASWPKEFLLDQHAQRLVDNQASIGTLSKSPFVVVDQVAPSYPKLRRAQRLSYVIWMLLDSILAGFDPSASTRQAVLEVNSTRGRLLEVRRGLDTINIALQRMKGT